MSNYCQGCKDRQDEIDDLEQTIRRLHNEHIDITHDVAARYIVEIDALKAENQRLREALELIAHCDDSIITGEDDGPELARRLRYAVNTAEGAQNASR